MTLELQIAAMKVYLNAKVVSEDWHGVSDAANDLRVLEAKLPEKKFLVQSGVKIRQETINGVKYTVVECA